MLTWNNQLGVKSSLSVCYTVALTKKDIYYKLSYGYTTCMWSFKTAPRMTILILVMLIESSEGTLPADPLKNIHFSSALLGTLGICLSSSTVLEILGLIEASQLYASRGRREGIENRSWTLQPPQKLGLKSLLLLYPLP